MAVRKIKKKSGNGGQERARGCLVEPTNGPYIISQISLQNGPLETRVRVAERSARRFAHKSGLAPLLDTKDCPPTS